VFPELVRRDVDEAAAMIGKREDVYFPVDKSWLYRILTRTTGQQHGKYHIGEALENLSNVRPSVKNFVGRSFTHFALPRKVSYFLYRWLYAGRL
jgi:hypothetical protein